MDLSKEPDVHPHMDTKDPSQEKGASVGQLRSPYVVVDRDHQPIDVSSPFIDDWTDINSNDVSSNDLISCSDISELDLNDALEAQPTAPTAQDASDLDNSSDQTQPKATSSVSDISDLNSEWESLSAEIWATVHPSSADIPDPNDTLEAQPTAKTPHLASDQDNSDPIRATTTSSLVSDISDLRDTLKAQSTARTPHVASDFEYLADQILATATLVVTSRQRLATANVSASNFSPRQRWEAANVSASNSSSRQSWEAANVSASNFSPRQRWEAANVSASNSSSRQRWEAANVSASNSSSRQGWATATTSASNFSSRQRWEAANVSASNIPSHQRWATATTSAPTQPAAPAPTNSVSPFARSSAPTQRIWPAPDPSKRDWAAAYVPSTAVNDDPVLPFNPIWYTPSSIQRFKPLPVPLPTYENGALPPTEPSSENLVLDVADDTFDPVKAVDPAMASDHVSPETKLRRTFYDFVQAMRECLRPFLNF